MADMRDQIAQAIEATIGQHEPGLVTRWVALIESVDTDGERGLWTLASKDAKKWDIAGMLTYGIHLEQARTLEDKLNGDN